MGVVLVDLVLCKYIIIIGKVRTYIQVKRIHLIPAQHRNIICISRTCAINAYIRVVVILGLSAPILGNHKGKVPAVL